ISGCWFGVWVSDAQFTYFLASRFRFLNIFRNLLQIRFLRFPFRPCSYSLFLFFLLSFFFFLLFMALRPSIFGMTNAINTDRAAYVWWFPFLQIYEPCWK